MTLRPKYEFQKQPHVSIAFFTLVLTRAFLHLCHLPATRLLKRTVSFEAMSRKTLFSRAAIFLSKLMFQ